MSHIDGHDTSHTDYQDYSQDEPHLELTETPTPPPPTVEATPGAAVTPGAPVVTPDAVATPFTDEFVEADADSLFADSAANDVQPTDATVEAYADALTSESSMESKLDVLNELLTADPSPLGENGGAELMAAIVTGGPEGDLRGASGLLGAIGNIGPQGMADITGNPEAYQAVADALGAAYDQGLISDDQVADLLMTPSEGLGFAFGMDGAEITNTAQLIGASGSPDLQQATSEALLDRWTESGDPALAYAAAHAAGDNVQAIENLLQRADEAGELSNLIDTLAPERLMGTYYGDGTVHASTENLGVLGDLFGALADAPPSDIGNQAFLEALDHVSGFDGRDSLLREGMGAYFAQHGAAALESLGGVIADQDSGAQANAQARQRMTNLSSAMMFGDHSHADAARTIFTDRVVELNDALEASSWQDDQLASELGFVVGGVAAGRVMSRAYSDTAEADNTLATFAIELAKNGAMEASQLVIGEIPIAGTLINATIDTAAGQLQDGLDDWVNEEFAAGRISDRDVAVEADVQLVYGIMDAALDGVPSNADNGITGLVDEQIDEMLTFVDGQIPSDHPNRDALDRLISRIGAGGA
ncbi:MAG: hypothetical protein AAF772_06600 [Acidobacteriota bacterium]